MPHGIQMLSIDTLGTPTAGTWTFSGLYEAPTHPTGGTVQLFAALFSRKLRAADAGYNDPPKAAGFAQIALSADDIAKGMWRTPFILQTKLRYTLFVYAGTTNRRPMVSASWTFETP